MRALPPLPGTGGRGTGDRVDVSLGREAAGDGGDDLRPERATPILDRRGQVRRSQLLARLDAVSDRVPVIVLAAPAGYGKTTALRQWVATGRRRVGWASLDPSDDEPARLAGHLAGALHELPMPAATADRLARIPATRPATAPALLLRSMRELRGPALLVLDNVQDVLSPESVALLRAVFERADPHGLQVAVASRSRHALALAGLPAGAGHAELGREELQFSEAESRQLLSTGARFEPGTQGEHKVARGFVPSHSWSAHHIADPRFRTAIADFLSREAVAVEEYAETVNAHVPYRRI